MAITSALPLIMWSAPSFLSNNPFPLDRASQIDAEQERSGSPSLWQKVYTLLRCPGLPCNLGPHCWRDSFGKKYYNLRIHHLKALVELVRQGHGLKSHEDVLEEICEQLYAEEHQRRERRLTITSVPHQVFSPSPSPTLCLVNTTSLPQRALFVMM